MRKTMFMLAFLLTVCFMANAQGLTSVSPDEQYKSSFDLSYQALDGGFGMGATWVINHFVLNGSMLSGDTNSYVTENEGWRVGIGGNYRYWLAKMLFVEGQAGVEYTHSTLEYKINGSKEKNSNGEFGLFVTPRVGLNLFKLWDAHWGITAGYRWDFNKFKFSSDYTDKYFTIGLIGVL